MYKNKEKERATSRERMRRNREKRIGVTKASKDVTFEEQGVTNMEGVTYSDILDKLTDPFWRGRLEKICHAFKVSHQPAYSEMCWLGDTNLSVACDYLEVTR